MDPKYLPIAQRKPDKQYSEALRLIAAHGEYTKTPFQTDGTYTSLVVPPMNYYLQNGFPLMTERKIGFWRKPIDELFAFINGVCDRRILAEVWGVAWWNAWVTPEKCANFGLAPDSLGPGSYGAAFQAFPTADGGTFNQFEHLVKQIKKYPDLRTHKITSWIPQYCLQHDELVRKVVVAPCHGDIQVTIIDGKMTLRMDQRSADFPIGVPSNTIQYAALLIALAHVTGYEPYLFIHATHDSQIYERHMEQAKEIIAREPTHFPSVYLTAEGEKVTNLFDFRSHHFELRDYYPNPAIKLADAVV